MTWLRYLNPFVIIIDYLRERRLADERREEFARIERMEEREVLRDTLKAMAKAIEGSFQVQKEFLASFGTAEAPRLREWDEEEADARYLQKKGAANVPKELAGLDKFEQFSLLVDKLNTFGID